MSQKSVPFLAGIPPFVLLLSCSNSPADISKSSIYCRDSPNLLDVQAIDGIDYYLETDGNLYVDSATGCAKVGTSFTPGFEQANYVHTQKGIVLKTPQGPFPVRQDISDPFDEYGALPDLFVRSIADTGRFWDALTLQSPAAPTVSDDVALQKCLLGGTCAFRDNRVELEADPVEASNQVLRFVAVAPTGGMVTSKASIGNTTSYFAEGDDLWFQARYSFSESFPYSIADFESEWFQESPGPRIVLDNGALAIEDKFGAKLKFRQANPVPVPNKQWVVIKVHFHFDHSAGSMELWQDGIKVLSANGPTIPYSFAIQTNIELGITATDQACTLLLDDVKVSDHQF